MKIYRLTKTKTLEEKNYKYVSHYTRFGGFGKRFFSIF